MEQTDNTTNTTTNTENSFNVASLKAEIDKLKQDLADLSSQVYDARTVMDKQVKEIALLKDITSKGFNWIKGKDKKESAIINITVNAEYEDEKGVIRLATPEEMEDPNTEEGACTNKRGWMVVELNRAMKIPGIYIKAYKGWGNTGYGTGASVYTSETGEMGVPWNYVCKVPGFNGSDVTYIDLYGKYGKFIRFDHESCIGFGYLSLSKP